MAIKHIPQDCASDEMVTQSDLESLQNQLSQQHQEMMEVLSSINDNLKILNTYMALITNHRIGDE